MLVNESEVNEYLYSRASIDTPYQVLIHLAKQFQRRRFKKILLMDWDEMSNLYRGPSIEASYQVSVHLA